MKAKTFKWVVLFVGVSAIWLENWTVWIYAFSIAVLIYLLLLHNEKKKNKRNAEQNNNK